VRHGKDKGSASAGSISSLFRRPLADLPAAPLAPVTASLAPSTHLAWLHVLLRSGMLMGLGAGLASQSLRKGKFEPNIFCHQFLLDKIFSS